MTNIRKAVATVAATALVATPLTLLTATPAAAADREFRYAGAKVELDVEKDDGRFEIDVDIDDAKPGSKWRVVLRHNGRIYHKRVHTADREGDVDIDKERPDLRGQDTFRFKIKRIGGPKAAVRVIKRR